MKQRHWFTWVVFAVLWLAALLLLTPAVLLVSGRNLPNTSIDITDSPYPVHYSIDSITVTDNLLKDVEITGWSFIENSADNTNKEVFLIFVSNKDTYQVRLTVYDRGDLPSALPNLLVPKRNTGFMGSFSSLAIRKGLYHLYILNKETRELYGIADTGRNFLIKDGNFEEKMESEQVKVTKPDQQAGMVIHSSIDSCNVVDNKLKVNGWAFVDGIEKLVPTFIKIVKSDGTEQFFSTTKVNRPDVAKYFGKDSLAASGFNATIPISEIDADEFTVWVYLEGIGTSSGSCVFPMQGESNK